MNIGNQINEQGFESVGLAVDGTPLTHVRSGVKFTGIFEQLSMISPDTMLSIDPREDCNLHVLRKHCPYIVENDLLRDSDSLSREDTIPPGPSLPPDRANPAARQPTLWRVTKRTDNPADVEIIFTVVKVTEKDST